MSAYRELSQRTTANLRVTLYWNEEDDSLVVEVEDFRDENAGLTITGIPANEANLAFLHPFTYRSRTAVAA